LEKYGTKNFDYHKNKNKKEKISKKKKTIVSFHGIKYGYSAGVKE
jgi:hypothetical protein